MGVLRALALLLVGAATALAAVALHGLWWGLLLAYAAVLATVTALPRGWTVRLPFGVGFGLGVGLLARTRPEGDFMVSGNGPGYLVLLLALISAALALATLPRPQGVRRPGGGGTPTYTGPR